MAKTRTSRWPLVVAANTLPVRRVGEGARRRWEPSPGGLVSALVPFVREARGAWVGWPGDSGRAPPPSTASGIANIPVRISKHELAGYYHGVCNRTLWPLYHDAVRAPEYRREWWHSYLVVNQRFADTLAELAAPRGTVWVQDYHLQIVPALLRERRPDLRIGFFLHIPFPPEELFTRLPWRRAVLEGLLGADVIGFQTKAGARNFVRLARHYAGARGEPEALRYRERVVHVGAFPISIDYARFANAAASDAVQERSRSIRDRLGGRRIILGVDRLDYTKGIDSRLHAYAEVLKTGRASIRDAVLVQVAVPSRERISDYQELRSDVEELVGRVNGQFGEVGTTAVHYLRRNLPFEELVAMYRSAHVMLVTPLCDGMNLVSKEYVATRFDNSGVLILSEFAGAAAELRQAVLTNPHDVDGIANAIHRALVIAPGEAERRMRAMRRWLKHHTVRDWAHAYLGVLRETSSRPRSSRESRRASV